MIELAAWLWLWTVGAGLTYYALAGVQSEARAAVQTGLLLLWVWGWPVTVPFLVALRAYQKHAARCRHYSTSTTTYIGRNPEPYVQTFTMCTDCGQQVKAVGSRWSGRQMQILLMRAEMMEPGTWREITDQSGEG